MAEKEEELEMMEEELERVGDILKDFENRHEKAETSQDVA